MCCTPSSSQPSDKSLQATYFTFVNVAVCSAPAPTAKLGRGRLPAISLSVGICRRRPAKYPRKREARGVSWYCLPYGRTTQSGLRRHGLPLRLRRNDVFTSFGGVPVLSTRAKHMPTQTLPAPGRGVRTRRGAAARSLVRQQEPWRAHHGAAARDSGLGREDSSYAGEDAETCSLNCAALIRYSFIFRCRVL